MMAGPGDNGKPPVAFRHRRGMQTGTSAGEPPVVTCRRVKGVGRHARDPRRYCPACRHPVGRCICRKEPD